MCKLFKLTEKTNTVIAVALQQQDAVVTVYYTFNKHITLRLLVMNEFVFGFEMEVRLAEDSD